LPSGFRIGISTKDFVYHDREERIFQLDKNPVPDFNKVWLQFLITACDINNKQYLLFIVRAFLEHSILYFKSKGLKKTLQANFHCSLKRKIIAVVKNVNKSRQISLSQDFFAHL
jgi:hypothetical protein